MCQRRCPDQRGVPRARGSPCLLQTWWAPFASLPGAATPSSAWVLATSALNLAVSHSNRIPPKHTEEHNRKAATLSRPEGLACGLSTLAASSPPPPGKNAVLECQRSRAWREGATSWRRKIAPSARSARNCDNLLEARR